MENFINSKSHWKIVSLEPDDQQVNDASNEYAPDIQKMTLSFKQWILDNKDALLNVIQGNEEDEEHNFSDSVDPTDPTDPFAQDSLPSGSFDEVIDQPEDENTNPNFQGMIRTVHNAHLIYKRKTSDGLYDELWIYNVDRTKSNEYKIRNDILRGTDIPPHDTSSEDGTQSYELWTCGNGQMMLITGLQN